GGAAVPDFDRAGAVFALGELPRERRVVEGMVLDVDGEVLLSGLERYTLRHCPARQRTVSLEPEVVVKTPRIVTLDDEDRLLRSALLRAEGLGRLLGVALALVLGELLGHRFTKLYASRWACASSAFAPRTPAAPPAGRRPRLPAAPPARAGARLPPWPGSAPAAPCGTDRRTSRA